MKMTVDEMLRAMKLVDLNTEIWGALFQDIIEKTTGGTKKAIVKMIYPVSVPGSVNPENLTDLSDFILQHLIAIGMPVKRIVISNDKLTFWPKQE